MTWPLFPDCEISFQSGACAAAGSVENKKTQVKSRLIRSPCHGDYKNDGTGIVASTSVRRKLQLGLNDKSVLSAVIMAAQNSGLKPV
jgi:hypothetical protein